MKKTVFFSLMVALAIVGCKKSDPTPTPTQDLIYTGENIIEVDEGTNFLNLKFTANKAWTAMVQCDTIKGGKDAVTIDKASGSTGEQSIKITFQDLEEGQNGRMSYVGVTTSQSEIPEEGTYFAVAYVQGKVFVFPLGNTVDMPVLGGSVSASFYTNCGYEVKKYDQFEEWAPCTVSADNTINFTVSENPGYDPRQAYVKFTVEEIQVPEYDDEGKPTGQTVAATYRFYVNQAGAMQEGWATNFDNSMALPSSYSIAKFGDKLYVGNAKSTTGLFVYDPETGKASGTLDVSAICADYINGVALDDAGNLLIAFGGNYPLEAGAVYVPLKIYSIAAGKAINATNAKKLVEYTNGFYGFGLDNIRVTGDVTKTAAISMVTAVGYDGGSFVVSWQITGGEAATPTGYSQNKVLPTGAAVWYSGDISAIHKTGNIDEGVFYMGYDSHYDLCYAPSMADEWSHVFESGSSWAENYSTLDIVEWNSHKYLVYVGTAFFQYWGLPTYVTVLNIDDPTKPVSLSTSTHYYQGGTYFGDTYVNETTSDVCAVVEGGNLVVYLIDAGTSQLKKLVYPAK